jgi:hypothetical protein
MIIDNELREKLVGHLPDDYLKQGSEATGYSRSMIYKVMHDGYENQIIAEWLVTTALKVKNDREQLLQISKQL